MGKKIKNKNISVPVFINLDSLGGRSLAHVLWSLGSDSCKRLCYPGACCCWRARFVFSHTGRWYTVSFHLVLLFIRRPIFCEYRNENLSDNPEFSRLTLPARNERDHMLHCWLEITLFITVFVIGASLYLLRINKCWLKYFDCEISYLLKFCMRSSILWVYLVVKTVRTHGWLCKQTSIFDSEFFCIYVVID